MPSPNRVDYLLTGLSSSELLANRVARLDGRWRPLDAQRPALGAAAKLAFRQVTAAGRAWPEPPDPSGLEWVAKRAQGVLAGLAVAQSPAVFVVRGHRNQLAIYWGASSGQLLEGLLCAQFPGVRLAEVQASLALQGMAGLPHCHLLVGVPSRSGAAERPSLPAEGLDRLVRGLLYGRSWALLVIAFPLSPAEDSTLIEHWSARIEEASQDFKPDHTVLAESNRLAELYLELLEVQLQRALLGRTQGNWLTETYIFGDAADAAAIAVATFGEEGSRPEAFRALPCTAQSGAGTSGANWPTWLNSADLANIVQLPLQEYPGYSVEGIGRFDLNGPPRDEGQPSLSLGWIQDLGLPTGHELRLERDRLTGHALIAGTTDSGKTNTSFYLLRELERVGVPFLVIEPTKGEYRFLRASFPSLRLITLGSNEAPLQVNPFYVPQGVPVHAHIDYLLSLFAASFVLYAPMPYVLEAALYEVYQDKGWDLAANACRRGDAASERAFPTLTDLCLKVEEVADRLGYEPRISADVKAALRARLNSLRIGAKGAMLDTHARLDVSALLKQPAVIEMRAVGDDEQKAFLIGLLLMMLFEHYYAQGVHVSRVALSHVTVIEEAHRLLQNVAPAQGGDFANPRGKAVETFANLIAEIRAYGEGLIVIEQSPTKLAPDVLKNTNLRVIHRIVSADDRETMARAANLDERQAQALASLPRGRAAVFSTGMDRPLLVSFPEVKADMASQPPAYPSGSLTGAQEVGSPLAPGVGDAPALRLEFVRWLLSTVWGATGDHAARLCAAVRASLPFAIRTGAMEAQALQALLPRLADWLATGLGAFYGWSFTDEECAQREVLALWSKGTCLPQLLALLTDGTRVEARPYSGCQICPSPCRYRFFAMLAAGDAAQRAETERVLQGWAEQGRRRGSHLAMHARYVSDRVVDPGATDMARGIGLCATVAAAHRCGWPAWAITEAAETVWGEAVPGDKSGGNNERDHVGGKEPE